MKIFDEEQMYDLYMIQKLSDRKIAKYLKVSRSSIQKYICEKGWSHTSEKVCLVCGKTFISKYDNNKFCSHECYLKYHSKKENSVYYRNLKSGLRICEYCGKEYYFDKEHDTYKNKVNADKYCSYECGMKVINKKIADTNLKRYGTTCSLANKKIRDKAINTWLAKYGVDHIGKVKSIQNKIKETNLKKYGTTCIFNKKSTFYSKVKQAISTKYGVENVFQNEKIKEKIKKTNIKKYGVDHAMKNKDILEKVNTTKLKRYGDTCYQRTSQYKERLPEIQAKAYLTKKKNGTFNTSRPEQEIKKLLEAKFKDVKYQYKSDVYPFYCDFYITKLDLYIEYQGVWSHGSKPFENTEEDLKKLSIWNEKAKTSTFYKSAIDVWTFRDPLKRKTAKENNLNLIEFFTFEEFIKWYNSLIL